MPLEEICAKGLLREINENGYITDCLPHAVCSEQLQIKRERNISTETVGSILEYTTQWLTDKTKVSR